MSGTNKDNIKKVIKEAFLHVQVKKSCHKKFIKKLTTLYINSNVDEFTETYKELLNIPLSHGENNPQIGNLLDFMVRFPLSLPPDETHAEDEDDVPLSTFAVKILEYCLEIHDADDTNVRFRVCHFLNKMLLSMPINVVLDDDLFDSLRQAMVTRTLDKVSKVRVQAICTLKRLEEPNNPDCQVQKLYSWHLQHDPCAEVRKAVINNTSQTVENIKAVISRIEDINENVRKAAYSFLSGIPVTVFSIRQREKFLKRGLNDPSKKVQDEVRNNLLGTWCDFYKNHIFKLLAALEAQTFETTSIQVLNIIFEESECNKLIKQIPLELESKLIPIDGLTSENALYWRCLIEFLSKNSSCEEKLDECHPELTKFCEYIQEYQTMMISKDFTLLEQVTQEFILCQLYKIVKTYDLSDEFGRRNLGELIRETLHGEKYPINIVELITLHYEKVELNVSKRVQQLTHIISEIHPMHEETEQSVNPVVNTEEGNDAKTIMRCLTIAWCMVQVNSVNCFNSTLRSLYDNLVVPSLEHPDGNVHLLALKTVGAFSLLSKDMAKERLWHFFLCVTQENDNTELRIIYLKGIFDFLMRYGLETFGLSSEDNDSSICEDNIERNFIHLIAAFCDHHEDSIRAVATEGLCKLLLYRRLSSLNLVSRFIIMLFNPANEKAKLLIGTLGAFFSHYPNAFPESQEVLERAFMLTLHTISEAPNDSPLLGIELEHIAGFMLQLTDPLYLREQSNHAVHNHLAGEILAEALKEDQKIGRAGLLKSLKHLNVAITSDQMKQDLISAMDNIVAALEPNERSLKICIGAFRKKIIGRHEQDANRQDSGITEGESEEDHEVHMDIEDDY